MQERAVKLCPPRWGLSATRAGARLDRWDRRLGASYAQLMRQQAVRLIGSLLALLLLLLLVIGKWQALARLLAAHHVAADWATWPLALNDVLQILFLVLLSLLVIVRRTVRTGTARLSGILAALGGTLSPLLLISESNQGLHAPLSFLTALLLLAGMGWSLWSLAMLGRCFSVLPEVRGLVTRGPYH